MKNHVYLIGTNDLMFVATLDHVSARARDLSWFAKQPVGTQAEQPGMPTVRQVYVS